MAPAPRRLGDAAMRRLRLLSFDQRMAAGLIGAMALLPLLAPLLGGSYVLHIGGRALILAVAAVSLELLVGVAGLVSFGHAAFLGIGAYGAGIAAAHGFGTLSVALPAALVASALFALLTGAIAVRTHGVYFIMITLAFGQMAFFVATSLAPYGGDDGLGLPERTQVLGTGVLKSDTAFFYVTLAVAAAAYVLVSRLVASRFGRVLRGATDSEPRIEAIGFAPYPFRLTAYVIAGAMCGVAGFLLGNHAQFVSPAYMHWQRSGELIVMVLLGGTGTLYGPILGALAFVLLEETLAGLTEHWKAILGPILVLVVLYAKGGLAGGIERAVGTWRRRGMSAGALPDALEAVLARMAARWPAAGTERWGEMAAALHRRRTVLVPLAGSGLARVQAWSRDLALTASLQLTCLALRLQREAVRARAGWAPWQAAARRRVDALRPPARRAAIGIAHLCRTWSLACARRIGRVALLAKAAAAEAKARWRPLKMALGRHLVSLVLLAERSVADATGRRRRR